jgi:Na+-transporting methylmalonyl-CoA/oxaloacetate decarboxylase gamma subunit
MHMETLRLTLDAAFHYKFPERMGETVFSLIFATVGMVAVFAVIVIITIVMTVSSAAFGSRTARSAGRPVPEPEAADTDAIPAEHVAAIALALAIHRSPEADIVVLLADGSGGRAAAGGLPSLRRTA